MEQIFFIFKRSKLSSVCFDKPWCWSSTKIHQRLICYRFLPEADCVPRRIFRNEKNILFGNSQFYWFIIIKCYTYVSDFWYFQTTAKTFQTRVSDEVILELYELFESDSQNYFHIAKTHNNFHWGSYVSRTFLLFNSLVFFSPFYYCCTQYHKTEYYLLNQPWETRKWQH